jgi:WD40 repeat protein
VGGNAPAVVDARSHRLLSGLRIRKDSYVSAIRFSPDSRSLFAVLTFSDQTNSPGASVRRFDARTGHPVGPERSITRRPAYLNLMLSIDARRVLITSPGDRTTIFDARTLRPLKRLPGSADSAALSPDGRTLLVGGRDGSVRFVDLAAGASRTGSGRHDGAVLHGAFSADGSIAATAGEDNRVIVWNVARATAGETFVGHTAPITGLAISRDNRTLYTTALDGKVIVWDLAGAHRLGRPFPTGPTTPDHPPAYALRPDGRVLAVGRGNGMVDLIDARTLRPLSTFPAVPHGPVLALAYAPRSPLLVVGGDNGFLALVDPVRGERVARLRGHGGPLLYPPSFSADGRLMATTSPNAVILWDLRSGKPVARPVRPSVEPVGESSLSPDGRTLAIAVEQGVEIVDVTTLRQRIVLSQSETIDTIRFTPDGRYVVGGSFRGWARLWSTKTGRPVSQGLAGHAGRVTGLAVNPAGDTLAVGDIDGTVRLYDLPTQQPLGVPLPAVPNSPVAPEFTPDGAYLFAITDAGRAYRWDVRPSSWARDACAVAGRTLTRTEWQAALPGRPYAPACR